MSKVSVLSGPERRRRWTTVEKLRIVEESQAPSASVIEVARRHDVHPNLLTVWRRQARTGTIGPVAALRQEDEVQFAAVSVAPEQPAWAARAGTGGTIEIVFSSGDLPPNSHPAAVRVSGFCTPLGVGVTCHRILIQRRLESRGFVRHLAWVEQRAIGGAGRGCAAERSLR